MMHPTMACLKILIHCKRKVFHYSFLHSFKINMAQTFFQLQKYRGKHILCKFCKIQSRIIFFLSTLPGSLGLFKHIRDNFSTTVLDSMIQLSQELFKKKKKKRAFQIYTEKTEVRLEISIDRYLSDKHKQHQINHLRYRN